MRLTSIRVIDLIADVRPGLTHRWDLHCLENAEAVDLIYRINTLVPGLAMNPDLPLWTDNADLQRMVALARPTAVYPTGISVITLLQPPAILRLV